MLPACTLAAQALGFPALFESWPLTFVLLVLAPPLLWQGCRGHCSNPARKERIALKALRALCARWLRGVIAAEKRGITGVVRIITAFLVFSSQAR